MARLSFDDFAAKVLVDDNAGSQQSSISIVPNSQHIRTEPGSVVTVEFYYNGGLGAVRDTRGRARGFNTDWVSVNGNAITTEPVPSITNFNPSVPNPFRPGQFVINPNNPLSKVNPTAGMYNTDEGVFWWGSFQVELPPKSEVTENLSYVGLLELTA